jgi:hypothetical protein
VLCTPYTARLSSGIVSRSKGHEDTLSVAVYQILILAVVVPIAADTMARIAAGFVRAEQVPNANVLGDVHTARQHPPQSVNPYMLTVECIEPMPAIEERTHPQLTAVLLSFEVSEELANIDRISEPQFHLLVGRGHLLFELLVLNTSNYRPLRVVFVRWMLLIGPATFGNARRIGNG